MSSHSTLDDQANKIWTAVERIETGVVKVLIKNDASAKQVAHFIAEYERCDNDLHRLHLIALIEPEYKVRGDHFGIGSAWERITSDHIFACCEYFRKHLAAWKQAFTQWQRVRTQRLRFGTLLGQVSDKDLRELDSLVGRIDALTHANISKSGTDRPISKNDVTAFLEMYRVFHRWHSNARPVANQGGIEPAYSAKMLIDSYLQLLPPMVFSVPEDAHSRTETRTLTKSNLATIIRHFPLVDRFGIGELRYANESRTVRGNRSLATYEAGNDRVMAKIVIYLPPTHRALTTEYLVDVVAHEIGHHVHAMQLDDDARAIWEAITLEEGQMVSPGIQTSYQSDNWGEEEFCEAYRIYRAGDPKTTRDRFWLAICHPRKYRFLEDHLIDP